MNNIVNLPQRNNRKPSGNAYQSQPSFDFSFYLGVGLTVVLPQVFFWYYFGAAAMVILTICSATGVGAGLGAYRKYPYDLLSCVPDVSIATTSDVALKLAA